MQTLIYMPVLIKVQALYGLTTKSWMKMNPAEKIWHNFPNFYICQDIIVHKLNITEMLKSSSRILEN